MSKILIVGNVLKDVYLKLDERQNHFEQDEQGISWLDLGFNGGAHGFFRRTSVFGGAAVSLAVLSRLGVEAKILGSRTEFKNGEIVWQDAPADYRYILCHEGEIAYFVPSQRMLTEWSAPNGTPEWILVDRSTVVSPRLVDEVKNFMKFSPSTKLAVHCEKRRTPAGQRLAELADVLFVEDEPPVHKNDKIVDKIEHTVSHKQLVCHLSPTRIVLGDAEEAWQLSKTDMMTHLTVYSTMVATILGVLSAGGSAADAVLWARLNAENSTLETSLSSRKLKELAEAEQEKRASLRLIAKSLVAPKHGVLAADQTDHALTERLVKFGIPATVRTRREYRELLLTTPELRDYAAGVILTPEVAKSKTARGVNFVEYLNGRGIIVGIKADLGQARLHSLPENYTLGLDGLAGRLRDFYAMGARFAKWHAKFKLAKNQPSFPAVEQNCELLAEFAKQCQLAGLVPMVEAEVSYAGDYTIEQNLEASDRVLLTLFDKLSRRNVDLTSVVLKTNMIVSGAQAAAVATPKNVGLATSAVLRHAVPKYIAGVTLLSGGLDGKTATANLKEVIANGTPQNPYPWPVTFAFGRALQDAVMQTWKGQADNVKSAQAALKRKLQENSQ